MLARLLHLIYRSEKFLAPFFLTSVNGMPSGLSLSLLILRAYAISFATERKMSKVTPDGSVNGVKPLSKAKFRELGHGL